MNPRFLQSDAATLTTGGGSGCGLLAGIGPQSASSLVLAGVDSTAIQARPAASPHLVSKFTSILKIRRLFLYFFSKRGSIYPKQHTVYGFCYVLRVINENGEKLSAIAAGHGWWYARPAILAGEIKVGQIYKPP